MKTRLIIALDFSSKEDALELISSLDPGVCALKVGSEMFTRFGADFVRFLVNKGFRVFLDLKFHDIPNTVAEACLAAADLGVWMMNVHASGGLKMMQRAREALNDYGKNRPLLVAVTVLTSMNEAELLGTGIRDSVETRVSCLALLVKEAGLDGVVCSAEEVPMIKSQCGSDFLTVTPGIRLPGDEKNDQVRIMTPAEAVRLGSDFLVVGRSITRAARPDKVIQDIVGYF